MKRNFILGVIIFSVIFGNVSISRISSAQPLQPQIILDPPAPNGEHGWYVTPVNISCITENWTVIYRLDNSSWQTYQSTICVNTDGHHNFSYYAIDPQGNVTPTKYIVFKIDQTPPYRFGDNTSGINRVEYYLQGALQFTATEPPYEWTLSPLPPGNITIGIRIYDNAGNNISIFQRTQHVFGFIIKKGGCHCCPDCFAIALKIGSEWHFLEPVNLSGGHSGYYGKFFVCGWFLFTLT